ncbi:MAG: hypothetical protein WCA78_05155 [Rhizomicrobium sp.]
MNVDENSELRCALDEAAELVFPSSYRAKIEQLRSVHGHRIFVHPDSLDREYNCHTFALGLNSTERYTLLTHRYQNLRLGDSDFIVSGKFMESLRSGGVLSPIRGREKDPNRLVIYLSHGRITHSALSLKDHLFVSKWSGSELHDHGMWEVPASYGDKVEWYIRPSSQDALKALELFLIRENQELENAHKAKEQRKVGQS